MHLTTFMQSIKFFTSPQNNIITRAVLLIFSHLTEGMQKKYTVSLNKAIKPKKLRVAESTLEIVALLRAREKKMRRKGREKMVREARRKEKERKNPAGRVGRPRGWCAVSVSPRVATCQITRLARVNNYSETHIIALHYAYIHISRVRTHSAGGAAVSYSFTARAIASPTPRKILLQLENTARRSHRTSSWAFLSKTKTNLIGCSYATNL